MMDEDWRKILGLSYIDVMNMERAEVMFIPKQLAMFREQIAKIREEFEAKQNKELKNAATT